MADNYNSLVIGLILLFLFGGLFPLIVADFTPSNNDYTGYLSSIINLFSFIPGSIGNFLVAQLTGFALIPAVLGIPLIIITFSYLSYGLIKILPENWGTIGGTVVGVIALAILALVLVN